MKLIKKVSKGVALMVLLLFAAVNLTGCDASKLQGIIDKVKGIAGGAQTAALAGGNTGTGGSSCSSGNCASGGCSSGKCASGGCASGLCGSGSGVAASLGAAALTSGCSSCCKGGKCTSGACASGNCANCGTNSPKSAQSGDTLLSSESE